MRTFLAILVVVFSSALCETSLPFGFSIPFNLPDTKVIFADIQKEVQRLLNQTENSIPVAVPSIPDIPALPINPPFAAQPI